MKSAEQMTDYISREGFLADKRRLYCENCGRRKGTKNGKTKFVYEIGDAPCRSCGVGDVLDDVEEYPAADVAPVVRCGECKWSDNYGLDLICQKHSGITKNKLGEDIHYVEWHSKNFFCADGERRDAK